MKRPQTSKSKISSRLINHKLRYPSLDLAAAILDLFWFCILYSSLFFKFSLEVSQSAALACHKWPISCYYPTGSFLAHGPVWIRRIWIQNCNAPLPIKRPWSLNLLALKILVVAFDRYGRLFNFQEIFLWSLNRYGCQIFFNKIWIKIGFKPIEVINLIELMYKITVLSIFAYKV